MAEWARWTATRMLRLYPRAWRERYGEEVEALLEHHDVGLCTAEDLLLGAFDAWTDPAFRVERRHSLSRTETLVGLLPFLGYGAAVVMLDLVVLGPSAQLPSALVYLTLLLYALAVMLLPLLGLGFGWVRGFPTWTYPFLGVAVMLALQNMSQPIPKLTIFGYALFGGVSGATHDLLGWRAWLPLLAMALVLLLVTRSIQPLRCLVLGIWRDWTLPSFAMYGVLPILLWIVFDEVVSAYRLVFTLAITSILVIGALAYLRSTRIWQRALALAASAAIAVSLAIGGSALYWHGVRWFTDAPPNGPQSALTQLGAVLALLLSPALLGVLRLLVEKVRHRTTVQVSAG